MLPGLASLAEAIIDAAEGIIGGGHNMETTLQFRGGRPATIYIRIESHRPVANLDPETFYSCTELAAHFHFNAEVLRGKLTRLRENDEAFKEIQNPRRNQPRFTYRLRDVLPLILPLISSDEKPSQENPKP